MKDSEIAFNILLDSLSIEELEVYKWELMCSQEFETRLMALTVQTRIDEIHTGVQYLEMLETSPFV